MKSNPKNRFILSGTLVNAFFIDGDMILLATTRGMIVLDTDYNILEELLYRKILGNYYEKRFGLNLCCEPGFKKDGSAFFLSFNYGNTIDKEFRG